LARAGKRLESGACEKRRERERRRAAAARSFGFLNLWFFFSPLLTHPPALSQILDDDITWRSNDDDGERGAKVYDPRAPPPPREAERAAAAAARLLESGAAEARVLLEREGGGGGGGGGADASGESSGKRKRNRKKDTGTKVEAPATPSRRGGAGASAPAPAAAVAAAVAAAAAAPPRFSTGAGIDFAGAPPSSSSSPALSSHPTLDRSFDLSTLPLSLRMLAAACGLEAPTKVQSSAWALATEEGEQEGEGGNKKGERKEKGNRNLLIVAPPGAGKTLAYLLPAAAKVVVESEEDGSGDDDDDSEDDGDDGGVGRRRKRAKKASSSSRSASLRLPSPRVLVLVPTRELARQVAAAARPLRRAAGLKVVRVAGGDRREDQVDRLRASSRGKGGSSKSSSVHVLVATPGRLLDLVRGGDVGLGELGVIFYFFCPRFVRARPDTFSSFLTRAEASRAHSRLMRFAPRPLPPYPRPRD